MAPTHSSRRRARVVVIGGGVGGASVLYHLTELGWKDVVLIERDELASGSTWHAAGQVTQFGTVQTMIGLKKYSVELYKRIAANPETPITYHPDCGGIRLGYDQSDIDGYQHFIGIAKSMGVDFELLTPKEMAESHPLLNVEGLAAGLWDPADGDIDPSGLVNALCHMATRNGGQVLRHTEVTGIMPKSRVHGEMSPRTDLQFEAARQKAVKSGVHVEINSRADLQGTKAEERVPTSQNRPAQVSTIDRESHIGGKAAPGSQGWIIQTTKGDIECESIVNAAGYRVHQLGQFYGLESAVSSMEHQYFLTEDLPEIVALGSRLPLIRDPGDDFYCRQERGGLLVGVYEQGCKTWGRSHIPTDFANKLLPPDLDRLSLNMERIMERLPALQNAGITSVINGPITYSGDGIPLVGRLPGLRNAYAMLGLRAGIGEGGGLGKLLAEIIVEGESEWDSWCCDPRRFTAYANEPYASAKAVEEYQREFVFHRRDEHRPAGRKAKTTPLYETFRELGAEFGATNGWERPLYFHPQASKTQSGENSPSGAADTQHIEGGLKVDANPPKEATSPFAESNDFVHVPAFRFSTFINQVGREVRGVRFGVGVCEISGLTRFEVSGAGADAWFDTLNSNHPPALGRIALAYVSDEKGRFLSEFTLIRFAEDRFWLTSSAPAEWHDLDVLLEANPPAGVSITNLTHAYNALAVAGPNSRKLLMAATNDPLDNKSFCNTGRSIGKMSHAATNDPLDNKSFPWLSHRQICIGGHEVTALRMSFTGELGWEFHFPIEHSLAVYGELCTAAESPTNEPSTILPDRGADSTHSNLSASSLQGDADEGGEVDSVTLNPLDFSRTRTSDAVENREVNLTPPSEGQTNDDSTAYAARDRGAESTEVGGLVHFGTLATESMRIEKNYREWKHDIHTEFTILEAGLGRFCDLNKGFRGRDAILAKSKLGGGKKFVVLETENDIAPAHTGDPIWAHDELGNPDGPEEKQKLVGVVTSGACGHTLETNIAMGYVEEKYSEVGTKLIVGIIGIRSPAVVRAEPMFDPTNTRQRE